MTLTGDAQIVEAVQQILQGIAEHHSKQQGSLYLLSSNCNSKVLDECDPRLQRLKKPNIADGGSADAEDKIFVIREKESPHTVLLWMNWILPALQGILSERLGGYYSASLVRRGPTNLSSVPCIHIESPCIPEEKTRLNIEQALNEVCRKNKHADIPVRFLKGNVRLLFGEKTPKSQDYTEEADQQRLKYQFNRPSLKPGMGASLGMLCSTNVSATLGGYIMMEGEKYILTSEHFIAECIKNVVIQDRETIVSPSPVDLMEIVGCLKQALRNKRDEFDSLAKATFGDQEIIPKEMEICPSLQEACYDLSATKEKLQQVEQPIEDFALGTYFRRSNDDLREALGTHFIGSNTARRRPMHYMDWAVCKVNSRAGENRHRYQSNRDALKNIDQSSCIEGLEDICHDTCDIAPGTQVYYLGQKSSHRTGTVNAVPMEVCTNGVVSHEWSIVDSRGVFVMFPSVEGDSGAWVLQKDKKLMGQIISHSTGQILFTPIKDIFADITEQLQTEITLPSIDRPPRVTAGPAPANFLCSVQDKPTIKAYDWMNHKKPTGVTTGVPTYLDLIQCLREIDEYTGSGAHTPQRPWSPVPSLIASPSSPKTTLKLFKPSPRSGHDRAMTYFYQYCSHVGVPGRSTTWPFTSNGGGSQIPPGNIKTQGAQSKVRNPFELQLNFGAVVRFKLRTGRRPFALEPGCQY